VPSCDLTKPPDQHFYLPMHGVVKDSSSTTKFCVVFDALVKSTSGHSLNDQHLTGSSSYPSLSTVISQFKSYEIAITGDISKMFRGIVL